MGGNAILKGRVAVVTGALGGIGRAISSQLAQQGATVALNDLKPHDQAEGFLSEFRASQWEGAYYSYDIAEYEQATALAQAVLKDHGKIDILVNNAGITLDKTLKNMSLQDWEQVLKIDLFTVFHCTRAVLASMLDRGYGRIISISSVVGQRGNFGQTNYAAAKAGIIGFTKSLALETAKKGITVNAIAPGFVRTPMVEKIPKEVLAKIVEGIPVGRLAETQEIARVVLFLADEASSYITGQVVSVNGGLYM